MSVEAFLDANVLLYACSMAADDRIKKQRAQAIMLAAPFALSAQVLQEFVANALRKKSMGITEAGIDAALMLTSEVTVLHVTLPLVLTARQLRRCYQVSHRESTILAAAQELGCEILYTEDLNDGQIYDGVKVVNLFRGLLVQGV